MECVFDDDCEIWMVFPRVNALVRLHFGRVVAIASSKRHVVAEHYQCSCLDGFDS